MPRFAPVTRPAIIMPSMRRCGRLVMMKRSLMVPGSLSSALQTTYFTGSGCLRTRSHFMLVGNPAPPMPFSSAALSWARTASHAFDGVAGDLFGVSGGDIGEDVIVDGNCRSMIAAAETGDVANLYIFWPRIGEAALEIGAQLASAVEMAAHVSADANL